MKKWFDDVLTYGWAHGPGGENLKGKEFMIATTTGGAEEEYRVGGRNMFTVEEYLRPIEGTIIRCHGTFLPAFASHNPNDNILKAEAKRYAKHVLSPKGEACRL